MNLLQGCRTVWGQWLYPCCLETASFTVDCSSTQCMNPSFLSTLQFFGLCLSVQSIKTNVKLNEGRWWMSLHMVWNHVRGTEAGKPTGYLDIGQREHTLYASSVVPIDWGPRVNYWLAIGNFCLRRSSKETLGVDKHFYAMDNQGTQRHLLR